jgi:ribosomal subunit interface protein
MNITLVDSNIPTTPAMLSHVNSRISTALDRFADRINEIRVHVVDANGPRGGVDKVCAIQVHIPRSPVIVVTHAAADYYEAVSAAVHRLKATLGRRLTRRRKN